MSRSPSCLGALRLALLLCLLAVLPQLHAQGVLKFAGVNLSGAEVSSSKKPGVLNVDYFYPSDADYAYFAGKGMNIVRLPVLWERLQPKPQGRLDSVQLALIKAAARQARAHHMRLILDIHNYASYHYRRIGSAAVPIKTFSDLWQRLAWEFKDDDNVVFGLMNEPHDISPGLWAAAAQSAVDTIRAAGARNLIMVPGALWSGAHSWYSTVDGESNATALASLYDPLQRTAIEVHQYLDPDSSGTSVACVSPSAATKRLVGFTNWLRKTRHIGFLGEFGASHHPVCQQALDDMLGYIEQNSRLWLGWTAWAGGAWWNVHYAFNLQPDADGREKPQMSILSARAKRITR
ncbi:glycoside hydrolase family 5 protein [Xanthomonas graminis]|uniref:Endoglucanase n=1 Tax=Xanthomonas graminis pv. poae TaxID=227946 RepID=A0A199NY50_9XANT|nr:glycoside hydrolase family 5 protein [Xanthomonas translucens]OAX53710.1 cellulase [Xanthomonas translucens pv. poae]